MSEGKNNRTAIVLMSGGVDSTACAYFLQNQGFSVRGVFLDFGQLASVQERKALEKIKKKLDIEIDVVCVENLGGMGDGELIGRNAFLIFTVLFLSKIESGILVIGVHSGTDYYDCSIGFINKIKILVEESTSGRVTVSAPFLKWTKGQVFQYFIDSGLSFDLTYSCEKGAERGCGICLSCKDRSVLGCY